MPLERENILQKWLKFKNLLKIMLIQFLKTLLISLRNLKKLVAKKFFWGMIVRILGVGGFLWGLKWLQRMSRVKLVRLFMEVKRLLALLIGFWREWGRLRMPRRVLQIRQSRKSVKRFTELLKVLLSQLSVKRRRR